MAAIHAQDLRIVKVESAVESLSREQVAQGGRMESFTLKIDALAQQVSKEFADLWKAVAALQGYQKVTMWLVVIGIPLLTGLSIWDRFFPKEP